MTQQTVDIIVYGASSFVGKILTRYMCKQFAGEPLTWAIAGRSKTKLEQLRDELGMDDVEIVIADAADEKALRKMCARTRVVISTVGPYALYGETLVKVCAETGTHYCDLTGETPWIRKMQERYEAAAQASGAWIVNCCGFDSIPSDLGVHFLQQHAEERFGEPCVDVKMRVKSLKGGASGGTVASMLNIVKEASKDAALRKELADPYSLCPAGHGFKARQHNVKTAYDDDFKSWVAPFVMAAINTRIVHRSNALSDNRYGDNFLYEEALMTGDALSGRVTAHATLFGLGAFMVAAALPPVRWGLERFVLPKPGEGPSPEQQLKGKYVLLFQGTTQSGEHIRCRVTGDRDPGYGSTAKMLAQAAACLAQDVPQNTPGGFWTPATLLGDRLVERLQKYAGVRFKLDK